MTASAFFFNASYTPTSAGFRSDSTARRNRRSRDKAKKTLGDKFNLREFHTAVLGAGTLPLDLLEKQVDAYLRAATVVASLPKGEQVVPVYHEPHHRQLFAYGTTRILEGQVPPGDTSWYHVHAEPVVYITLSASAQRTQVLGEDWGRGREGAAPAAAGAGRGGPPAGRGAPPNGAAPAIRATSTTSYFDQPVTHRITNAGDRLFRFMVVSNASPGDESASTPADAGFSSTPEMTNRWFRAYRIKLAPGQSTETHRHSTESVIVQVSDGQAFATGAMTWDLGEQGRWAWFDGGKEHQIKNVGTVPFEAIEVEVRRPPMH
jgi:quercetin dioxygenase-like cupin family protein